VTDYQYLHFVTNQRDVGNYANYAYEVGTDMNLIYEGQEGKVTKQ
jgi:hypothetical protein